MSGDMAKYSGSKFRVPSSGFGKKIREKTSAGHNSRHIPRESEFRRSNADAPRDIFNCFHRVILFLLGVAMVTIRKP
jgi:hypothetical protein